MGRTKDISAVTKAKISIFLEVGQYTHAQIAQKVGVSRSFVSKFNKNRGVQPSTSPRRKGKCGRKRKTTGSQDRYLLRKAKEDRTLSSKSLRGTLRTVGVEISERTVRRRLFQSGLCARRPRKKQRLNARMIKQRKTWANEHLSWSAVDWEKVVFSDETMMTLTLPMTRTVRRSKGEEYLPSCVQQQVKQPVRVMVWSAISSKGLFPLYVVNGIMNANKYLRVLQTQMIPPMIEKFNGEGIFMHDKAPCHTAKKVTKFLRTNSIQILDWPANSPDMNPIENIWAIFKQKVAEKCPRTKSELIAAMQEIWENDPDLLTKAKNSISGMPRRIQLLKNAKGMFTKY